MDRETLRALIVDFRDNKGMTFEQIASELNKSKTLPDATRQSVFGIYTRAKGRESESQEDIVTRADVVNLYVLGYNRSQIGVLLKNSNSDISYSKVRQIISNETDYISKSRDSKVLQITKAIVSDKLLTVGDTKAKLIYKGIEPTDSGARSILSAAYTEYIKTIVSLKLTDILNDTGDSELIKDITTLLGLNTKTITD